jgi:hypothetical protein
MAGRNGGKRKNIFKQPPAICLRCGPADKMKIVPKACIRCGFRAAADPTMAEAITNDIAAVEKAAQMTWSTTGRCLDDLNKKCPVEVFGKEIKDWICKGLPCEITLGERGEEIHPHFRCWAAWLGHEMAFGSYSPMALESRRVKMQRKCDHPNEFEPVKGKTVEICPDCGELRERE